MPAGRQELYEVITKCPQRKQDDKNNNRKVVKYKQNKKMPGIYSFPLKCDLCSTFGIKQKQRPLLDGYHRRSWGRQLRVDLGSKKGERFSQQLAGITSMSWSSCRSLVKSGTMETIQCSLTEMTCLSLHFKTNYSESQALGLCEVREENRLYNLEASALLSLLIVSSWFFV